jgi:hypothetical protein
MSKYKKKSEVRESKPLAESPKYDADASTLAENLKKIQAKIIFPINRIFIFPIYIMRHIINH